MKALKLLAFAVAAIAFTACEPSVPSKTELGELPTAGYTVTEIDSNTVRLTSNSSGEPFLYQWEVEGVGVFTGEEVDVFISTIGVYNVEHKVFNQGGHDVATGTVEIFRDAPLICEGAAEFLTDCTLRTWKMAPIAGCLWVGPVDGSQTWWFLPASGPVDRPCLFNDEWTFDKDAKLTYDTKGDLWAETYMGVAADGCQPESFLTGDKADWGSGVHDFEVIPDAGVAGMGQLKLIGSGAFIGLPKATNVGQVSSPVADITYDILSMTDDGTARYMEIEVNYGDGLWRFTIYSEL